MAKPVVKDIALSDIIVADRFRKKENMDLQPLMQSISEVGLLQPILVDPDNNLVCGERRFRAFQELGRDSIPCYILRIDDPLFAEWAENESRKAFTVSERVAIATAIADKLGERRGGDKKSDKAEEEPEHLKGKLTSDIAATGAGFGNHRTFLQAKEAVEKGSVALVEALDAGEIKINAAYLLSQLPKSKQQELLREGSAAVREAVAAQRNAVSTRAAEGDEFPASRLVQKPLASIADRLDSITAELKKRRWKLESSEAWSPEATADVLEDLSKLKDFFDMLNPILRKRAASDAGRVAEARAQAEAEAERAATEKAEARKAKAAARKAAKAEADEEDDEESEEDWDDPEEDELDDESEE